MRIKKISPLKLTRLCENYINLCENYITVMQERWYNFDADKL